MTTGTLMVSLAVLVKEVASIAVVTAMAKEVGLVVNATVLVTVHTVAAMEDFLARHAVRLGNVENAEGKAKSGAPNVMERVSASTARVKSL